MADVFMVHVLGYTDDGEGRLGLVDGKMRMSRVTLRPRITLESNANEARAHELVATAHAGCFIANSVATPIDIVPTLAFADAPTVSP